MSPPAEADRLAQQALTTQPADLDPEIWYYQGTIFAFCGKPDAALHMFSLAIEQNYCSYSQLLSDPLLAKLRKNPRIDPVLTAASNCQDVIRTGAK
jgi:hypothetical protein